MRKYLSLEAALKEYEDICSESRLLICILDPRCLLYCGKSGQDLDSWTIEEAKKIVRRYNDWTQEIDLPSQSDWDALFEIVCAGEDIKKVKAIANQ